MPRFDITEIAKQGNEQKLPVLGAVEDIFDAFGLMRGPFAPALRAGVGFGVVWLVMAAIRPSFAYDESGQARPWKFGSQASPDGDDNSTLVPWWMLPLGGAFVSSVLV